MQTTLTAVAYDRVDSTTGATIDRRTVYAVTEMAGAHVAGLIVAEAANGWRPERVTYAAARLRDDASGYDLIGEPIDESAMGIDAADKAQIFRDLDRRAVRAARRVWNA